MRRKTVLAMALMLGLAGGGGQSVQAAGGFPAADGTQGKCGNIAWNCVQVPEGASAQVWLEQLRREAGLQADGQYFCGLEEAWNRIFSGNMVDNGCGRFVVLKPESRENGCGAGETAEPECAGGDCGTGEAAEEGCAGRSCREGEAAEPECAGGDCGTGEAAEEGCAGESCREGEAAEPECVDGNCGQDKEEQPQVSYAEQILQLVNAERAKAGLGALILDEDLNGAAQVRAGEIQASFSHTRPDGRSFSSVLTDRGIRYLRSGENIAWGQRSAQEVMDAWMNSEGHRANILNAGFTRLGVGHTQDVYGRQYWSQLFMN